MVVQTSGLGNEFPAGIPIGKVIDYVQKGINTQQLIIKPFNKLSEVSVVLSFYLAQIPIYTIK